MPVTPENLLATVQRLVDQDDIRRLLYDYTFYLDLNDPQRMLSLFTPDCHVSYGAGHGAEGIEAYRETLADERFGIGAFFAATSHHVSNVVIDFIDDDTADVRAVVYAWHRYNRDRPDGVVMGQYHDVVVRTPDGWRLHRLELKSAGTVDYHAKDDALDLIPRHDSRGTDR